jgi:hypothetical protein
VADLYLVRRIQHAVKSRRKFVIGIVLGILLTLAPLFGLLPILISMTRAFLALGASHSVSGFPDNALVSTAAGLFLCPIGIVILAFSLLFYFRSRRALASDRGRRLPGM